MSVKTCRTCGQRLPWMPGDIAGRKKNGTVQLGIVTSVTLRGGLIVTRVGGGHSALWVAANCKRARGHFHVSTWERL